MSGFKGLDVKAFAPRPGERLLTVMDQALLLAMLPSYRDVLHSKFGGLGVM